MNSSDKKLLFFNIETSHQLFLRFSVYKVVWRSTHCLFNIKTKSGLSTFSPRKQFLNVTCEFY